MLFWKFKLGLFDDPFVDPAEAERVAGCERHRELALQAARETITLLKNENELLPLESGEAQDHCRHRSECEPHLLGGYSGVPKHNVTVLDGIKSQSRRPREGASQRRLQNHRRRFVAAGRGRSSDPAEDRKQIAEAVKVAKQADVIVLAVGGNEQTSREAWSLEAHGRPREPGFDGPAG